MKPYIITSKLDWNGPAPILVSTRKLAGPSLVDEIKGRKSEAETYPHKFRLLDAEGVVLFEGYSREDSCLEAFDDLENNYGLTDCQYKEDGKWTTINC